jgi:hypothetical protein
MTECFWCQTVYDERDFDKCSNCLSDLNTKEIKIITTKKDK